MPIQIIITADNGLAAATEVRNLLLGLQLLNPVPTEEQAAAGAVAPKKAKPVEADEEPKKAVKKVVKRTAPVEEEDEEEEETPKKKTAVKKPAADEDDEDEPKAPVKKSAAGKTSVGELKDDGEDQPATVEGCRIMIRRVARAFEAPDGTAYAQAVLAEFGIEGASKVPAKKFQSFIDRCQEVIDEPDSIELAE